MSRHPLFLYIAPAKSTQMADYSSTSLFTLIPQNFAREDSYGLILRELFGLDETYSVLNSEVPEWGTTLLYAWEKGQDFGIVPSSTVQPLVLKQLKDLRTIKEHNKLIMDFDSKAKRTTLLLAEGEKLITANSYHTVDLPSAIYYMLEILRKSQINPQQTTLHFSGKADDKELKTLRSYVKDVRLRM